MEGDCKHDFEFVPVRSEYKRDKYGQVIGTYFPDAECFIKVCRKCNYAEVCQGHVYKKEKREIEEGKVQLQEL